MTKQFKLWKNFFNKFFLGIKLSWKDQRLILILYFVVFLYYIRNAIKFLNAANYIWVFMIV